MIFQITYIDLELAFIILMDFGQANIYKHTSFFSNISLAFQKICMHHAYLIIEKESFPLHNIQKICFTFSLIHNFKKIPKSYRRDSFRLSDLI